MEYKSSGELCDNCIDSNDIPLTKINQTLWPDHCVMDTEGANLSSKLEVEDSDVIVRKGYHCKVSFEEWLRDTKRFFFEEFS